MDRFHRGLISGIISGVLLNILDLINYYLLHITTFRMLDWAGVMLYGYRPLTLPEEIYALIAHLIWTGFLGIIFSFAVQQVTSSGYLTKGAFYGFITGFIIYSFTIAFRVPHLAQIPFKTSLSNGVEGVIWGIALAYTLKRLDTSSQLKQ